MSGELNRKELLRMYAWVSKFVNKIAWVRDNKGDCFHIRPNGAPLYSIGHGYSLVGHFSGNLAMARAGTEEFHIRRDGRPAYKERYLLVGTFSEGLALACDHSGYFHIHPNGVPAYRERYDETRPFAEGFAVARVGRYFIFITPDGKPLTEELFSYASPFQDDYAVVIKNGEEWLLDREGRLSK